MRTLRDPAKLAKALLKVVDQEHPPLRWVASADAVGPVDILVNNAGVMLLAPLGRERSEERRRMCRDQPDRPR